VLAIATGIQFDLVEADQRKAAFLREAVRATGAPATVHAARVETISIRPAPLVTARAVAPLPILLSWATRLLAPGGVCLFPKGRTAATELTAAAGQWHMHVERFASPTDPQATILRLSEISRVRHEC
jgi:16S rRNA (guanine527-N7)-methyltransferase